MNKEKWEDDVKVFEDITAQYNDKINELNMELKVIPIIDPQRGKVIRELEDGEQFDIGQLITWEVKQVMKLQSRIRFNYNPEIVDGPVTLLCNEKRTASGATIERFDTFEQLAEKLVKRDCIVYQIMQNLVTGRFALRFFPLPEGFDYKLHTIIVPLLRAMMNIIKDHDKHLAHNALYDEIVKISKHIRDLPRKAPPKEAFKQCYHPDKTVGEILQHYEKEKVLQ